MFKNWSQSIAVRLFSIGFLILILMIPTLFMSNLVRERKMRRNTVVHDVARQWSGGEQSILGPILSIPYKSFYKDEKGKVHLSIHYAHFLPEALDIKGELLPEERYRGIYKVALYDSQLHFTGSFVAPNFKALNILPQNVIWKDAALVLSTGGVKGIKEQIKLKWNNTDCLAESGVQNQDIIHSGLTINVPVTNQTKRYTFAFDLKLKGYDRLTIAPIGKLTTVALQSTWSDPSFSGTFLPTNREITEQGFQANWKVMDINRGYPQYWSGERRNINWAFFGVDLYQPIDHYQKVDRVTKYALMFIVLTFLAFFILEVLKGHQIKRIHPVQYLMIGSGLILFYSLLLSLSEHIGFLGGYLIAGVVIIGLVTSYSRVVLNKKLSFLIGGLLLVLYTYLYTVLQLEDYALLIGSIGLLSVLGLTMYLTRNINWYAINQSKEE